MRIGDRWVRKSGEAEDIVLQIVIGDGSFALVGEGFEDDLYDAGEKVKRARAIGTCRFCGSPLFKSRVDGYTYECLECDEDFFAFEQE